MTSEVSAGEPEGEGRANWGAPIRHLHADGDAPALVELLGGGEGFWTRAHAREALIDLGSEVVLLLIDALRHPNRRVRAGAGAALGRIGDQAAVKPLLDLWHASDPWTEYRSWGAATGALGALRARAAVEPFIQALLSLTPGWIDQRQDLAGALGRIGDRRAVERLIEILDEGDVFTRAAVARALRELGGKEATAAADAFERR